ncbi:MAG: NADH-ubiquinone oxidoreductase-F iron-sulfur binding region domain-containing protein [Acidobacteriota bacterium]
MAPSTPSNHEGRTATPPADRPSAGHHHRRSLAGGTHFIEFLTEESCGKCVPGREGLRQMMHRGNHQGEGEGGEMETTDPLSETASAASLCAQGKPFDAHQKCQGDAHEKRARRISGKVADCIPRRAVAREKRWTGPLGIKTLRAAGL